MDQSVTQAQQTLSQSSGADFKQLTLGLSVVAMAIATTAIFGWILDIPALVSIQPDWARLKMNTAIGLIILSIGLIARAKQIPELSKYRIPMFCGIAVGILSILTFIQYGFNVNLGIDNAFVSEKNVSAAYSHGRMAFITALDFFLLGFALITIDWEFPKKHFSLSRILSSISGCVALFPFVGYTVGLTAIIQFGLTENMTMSLHTSVAFLALSIGMMLINPEKGLMRYVANNTLGGLIICRLIPFILIILPLLRALVTQGILNGYYDIPTGAAVFVTTTIIIFTGVIVAVGKTVYIIDKERLQLLEQLKIVNVDLEKIIQQRTEEIIAKEIRHRAIFEQAAVGIAEVGLDGRWKKVNQTLCQMLGYAESELLQLTFQDITHPDDLEIDLEYARALRNGEMDTYSFEKKYICKDKSILWANLTVAVVKNKQNEPEFYVSVIQDICERKRAQEELTQAKDNLERLVEERTNELTEINRTLKKEIGVRKTVQSELKETIRRFYGIFNQTFQFIGLLDTNGTILEANQSVLDSFGVEKSDIKGLPLWETTNWMQSKQAQNQLKDAIKRAAEGEVIRFETYYINAAGKTIWIDFSLKPILDEKGKVVLLIPEGHDITELKETEQAFKNSEERYRLLVSRVQDYAIIMLDAKGKVITWNEGAQRILGYTSDEIMGKHYSEFYTSEATLISWPEHQLRTAASKGRFDEEGWRVRKDGTLFWASVLISPIYDTDGDLLGFSKIARDVSERKMLEEARQKMIEQLQENAQLRRNFVSTLTHDLRTPLIAQQRVLTILQKEQVITNNLPLNSLIVGFLNNNDHLLGMVNKLLEVYQYEDGTIQPLVETLDPKSLIAQCFQEVGILAKNKKIKLKNDINSHFSKIEADPQLFKRIVGNLLGNAIENCREGDTINIKGVEQDNCIQIQVCDNGPGIPAEVIPHLFKRYSSSQSARRKIGSGLGLYICKMIMELHGGSIDVESNPHTGTQFILTLQKQYKPQQEVELHAECI